jgi:uncharacterized alpha-E superfamily protein
LHSNPNTYCKVEYLIGKVHSKIKYTEIEDILKIGLRVFLKELVSDLLSIGDLLNQHYFSPSNNIPKQD